MMQEISISTKQITLMTLLKHSKHTLKHKERQPRYYTKKSVEYWKNTIKTRRKAHKCLSIESNPAENEPTAIKPPPKQMKRGRWK